MSNLITTQKRSVRFYALGGTGANMIRNYLENHPRSSELLGEEHFCYIDTSLSNLVGVNADNVFHVKRPDGTPLDGAGGDRAAVAAAVQAALPEIMSKFPPAEKNYLIFSLSGGSGPTAAHILAKDLLERGLDVAGVCVRSSESTKRVDTTIKVLTGFEGIVKAVGRPFVISLHENDEGKSRDENNAAPVFDIASLSILSSGLNESMDSADVSNLFDYHKVTHHQPGVALLRITADIEHLKQISAPIISFATVAHDRNETIPKMGADYDTAGYMRQVEGDSYKNSFYYAVSQASAAALFKDLIAQRAELENKKKAQQPVVSLMAGSAQGTTSGDLVF